MKECVRVMKALSDPNRIKVLKMLEGGELCVCEIQPRLKLSQSTTSKHLRILEDAGLVEKRKDGQWVIYRLADGSQSVYAARMLESFRQWLGDDPDIRAMKKNVHQLSRTCTDTTTR
ncbi:ArsR/SmtB family transcription factor [Desulfolithobacter sp.]